MTNVNGTNNDEKTLLDAVMEYGELREAFVDLFNLAPVAADVKLSDMIEKLKKISNFIQEIQCTCVYDSIEGHTVCKRCELLGRFEDEPV